MVAAVSLMRFTPAEMNWHTVSQKQKFEFSINDDSDVKKIDPTAAAGRLLERLEIVGNRRISAEQIRSWMKTRVGEPYDSDQIQRDLTQNGLPVKLEARSGSGRCNGTLIAFYSSSL